MDKELLKQSFKGVLADRPVLLLVIAQVAATIIYLIAVGLSIHVSDVTVYVRYTAFGEAHFYKNHWPYLLLFMVFGLLVAAIHTTALAKFHQIGRRQSALFVGWMGVIITILALIYALAVISLGRAA